MSSCGLLLGRPLDVFPLLSCHSVQRLVYQLSFILAMCPAHIHFCFSVFSIMSFIFVLFLISENCILCSSLTFNIFLSIALLADLSLFVSCLLRSRVWHPQIIVGKTRWPKTCFLSNMGSCLSWNVPLFFPKQLHAALILGLLQPFPYAVGVELPTHMLFAM